MLKSNGIAGVQRTNNDELRARRSFLGAITGEGAPGLAVESASVIRYNDLSDL